MEPREDFGVPDAREHAHSLVHAMEMAVLDSPYEVTTTVGTRDGVRVEVEQIESARARVRGVLLWFIKDQLPESTPCEEITLEDRVLIHAQNDLTTGIAEISRVLGPLRQKAYSLLIRAVGRQSWSPVAVDLIRYFFPYRSEWAHPEAHLADVSPRLRAAEFRYAMLHLLREEVQTWRAQRPN